MKNLGGRLAQLGEHRVRNAGVGGSNPLPSTIRFNSLAPFSASHDALKLCNCARFVLALVFPALHSHDFLARCVAIFLRLHECFPQIVLNNDRVAAEHRVRFVT